MSCASPAVAAPVAELPNRVPPHAFQAPPVGSAVMPDHAERARRRAAVEPVRAERTRARVAAWYVPWDREGGMATLRANGHLIGELSPFWFELATSGRGVRSTSGAHDSELLLLAREHGMVIMPTVSNSFDPKRATRMLATSASRQRHVRQLVALVSGPAYAGIDVDYENIAPSDRARFTSFVRELATALHARDKLLSVTVMAKTEDRGHSAATRSMDYRAIGQAADQVRVMAYDYHWSCGPAGPIAPIEWVRDVAAYSAQRIDPGKVVLGVPFYGYDWPRHGGCAAARVWRDVSRLQRAHGGRIAWNERFGTSMLSYLGRQLWFEDRASIAAKARVADEHGLRGVVAWRLGGEDPGIWAELPQVLGDAPPGSDDEDIAEPIGDPGYPGDPIAGSDEIA